MCSSVSGIAREKFRDSQSENPVRGQALNFSKRFKFALLVDPIRPRDVFGPFDT